MSTTAAALAPTGGPTQPRSKWGLGCLSVCWGALRPVTSRCRGSPGCPEITFKQENASSSPMGCARQSEAWYRGTSICVGNPHARPGSDTEQDTQTPVC